MNYGIWNRRIPTIAAFSIVAISIWVTTLIVQRQVSFTGKASSDLEPKNISITNTTDTSFVVQFTTKEKTIGAVTLLDSQEALIPDIRDRGNKQQEFYAHRIEVKNLKPDKAYSFSLIVDNKTIQDHDSPFLVKTSPQLSIPVVSKKTVNGRILLSDGSPALDAAVFVSIPDGQKLSGVTNDQGEYSVSLTLTRTSTNDSYYEFNDESTLTLELYRQDLKSTIHTLYKDVEELPVTVLSESYDFTQKNQDISFIESPQGFNIPEPSMKPGEVKILSPKENASFIDSRPLFQGSALPNSTVKITIHSVGEETVTITSNQSGIWSYRPPSSLAPGKHTITVESVDAFGIIKRLQQTFTVFSAGSQVSQTATPSATPTTTIPPTPTPTSIIVTPPVSPTSSPTLILTPSPTNTTLPPQKPTGTITKPGGITSSLILTALSALFIIAGATLLFILG